jgi:eukaryotic-like serine/threonine-protein kinase
MPRLEIDARTWSQLNQLLDAALDEPASHRDHWLETLAPEYVALKPLLRDLLARAGGTEDGHFLSTIPKYDLDAADLAEDAADGDQPGDTVGPYRLVRGLGSGGMGVVWLAERMDGLVNRPVALKLPHRAWKRAGLAERMSRERAILASLTHPNIARLYDAGLTAEGRPFLAIEYVEGRSIDEYCHDHDLDTKARVKLFAQVANAVAYAHAKLVVHRDLKPANILVTGEGQVRLLDFGIAKLLEDRQAKETRLTEFSGRALTPDYASPEQILAEPLTIASDVYSLGVILYELLTGQRPYKLRRDSRGALEDAILEADPLLPSDVADRTRRRALVGDLDTIVLKALKKKPEERYATVHALVDDLERYLEARPVLARSDSLRYRVRKFVARNRIAVAAAAAVLLAIVVGASVAAWQARVALAEKRRAEEVKDLIAAVFREADPTQGPGKVLSAAELLRQAERRLHDRAGVNAGTQVELLEIIGESLFGLQENADAARVIEQALQLQASSTSPDALLGARLHLVLSQADELLGRNDDARRELDRAFAALAASGNRASALFVQAKVHQSALGIVFNDYAVAEQAALEAISVASAIGRPTSSEVAIALQRLSHVYTLTERRAQAVEPARRAFTLLLDLHAHDPTHPEVIESTVFYAQALQATGNFEDAFDIYRDALAKSASVFGDDSRSVGETLSSMVPLEIEIGALQQAIAHARRAIDIYLKEGKPGSATHGGRVRKLGSALLAARSAGEAAARLDEAVRLSVAAKSGLEALHARGSYGLALTYLGRFDEADRQLRQTIDASIKSPRAHFLAVRNLGTLLRLQGRYAESLPWLEKAIAESAIQPGHRGDHAHCLVEAGLVRMELGEVDTARDLFARAETLFNDVQKQRITPARADLMVGTARVQLQRREYAAALQSTQSANLFWRDFDPENRSAGEAALWLGRCYQALGRTAEAADAFSRAAHLLARSPVPTDAKLLQLARAR